VVRLTGSSRDRSRLPSEELNPDDLSGNAHRQLIGYLGLALPLLLFLISGLRPTQSLPRWRPLDSVSAYYYSGSVAAFVGLLVALALFLLAYRGYDNRYGWADRAAARGAGISALLVAGFPTEAPAGVAPPAWWAPWNGVVHYVAAVALFGLFALFSLWLFRLGAPGEQPDLEKVRRNRIYLASGIIILASMLWAGIAGSQARPIFLPESVALAAFAVSWLVKGRAGRTIIRAIRS